MRTRFKPRSVRVQAGDRAALARARTPVTQRFAAVIIARNRPVERPMRRNTNYGSAAKTTSISLAPGKTPRYAPHHLATACHLPAVQTASPVASRLPALWHLSRSPGLLSTRKETVIKNMEAGTELPASFSYASRQV